MKRAFLIITINFIGLNGNYASEPSSEPIEKAHIMIASQAIEEDSININEAIGDKSLLRDEAIDSHHNLIENIQDNSKLLNKKGHEYPILAKDLTVKPNNTKPIKDK